MTTGTLGQAAAFPMCFLEQKYSNVLLSQPTKVQQNMKIVLHFLSSFLFDDNQDASGG